MAYVGGLQSPMDPMLVNDQLSGDLYGHWDHNSEYISAWKDYQHTYLYRMNILLKKQ